MLLRHALILPACSLWLLSASLAIGDDRLEVEIDSLKGTLRKAAGGWELRVRFEIEIENARPGASFELLLQVAERGKVLRDGEGKPITIVVPLDQPSEVDDDEIEFEGNADVSFTAGAIHNPRRLRLIGVVVHAGDDRPLDRVKKRIKFKCD